MSLKQYQIDYLQGAYSGSINDILSLAIARETLMQLNSEPLPSRARCLGAIPDSSPAYQAITQLHAILDAPHTAAMIPSSWKIQPDSDDAKEIKRLLKFAISIQIQSLLSAESAPSAATASSASSAVAPKARLNPSVPLRASSANKGKKPEEYDHLFKILLLGDIRTGKSCMLLRFTDNTYSDSYISNIGVDFKTRTMTLPQSVVKLQVCDTTEHERERTIQLAYKRPSHAVFFVFDLTNKASFDNIKQWQDEYKRRSPHSPLFCLIGTKHDLLEKRQVTQDEALVFAAENNMPYFETSAKSNTQVEEAFKYIADSILEEFTEKTKAATPPPAAPGFWSSLTNWLGRSASSNTPNANASAAAATSPSGPTASKK